MEEIKIFEILHECKSSNFQNLWLNLGCPNRNSLNKILNNFIQKGFIKTKPKNWKKGKSKFYSLTSKGKKQAKKIAYSNVTDPLKKLAKISKVLASKNAQIIKFINKISDQIEKKTFLSKKTSFSDALKEYDKKTKELYQPINNVCKNVHQIHSSIKGNGNAKDSVTIIYKNNAFLIGKDRLEGLNLGLLLFMKLSDALKYEKNNKM